MKTALITGASSGIGKKFAELLHTYGKFDKLIVIARREDRLLELKNSLPYEIDVFARDLSKTETFYELKEKLEREKVKLDLLINCSGFGKFEAVFKTPLEENLNMVDLNCKAVMATCQICIPFMKENSKIINVASVAGFQPIPYINVYGATKSFVLHFSRALNRELKKRKIKVTAVCPFWTKTEFFNRAVKPNEETIVKKYVAMYTPEQIVKKAYKDVKKGKDVSIYGFKAKMQVLLVKMLPHKLVMNVWQSQQKLK